MVTRIAVGSRGAIAFADEKEYGIPVEPRKTIDFVSESMNAAIGDLVSNAINPTRAILQTRTGTTDVGGDINFEQNANGLGVFYRHALGDVISAQCVDGGIGAQLSADTSAGSTTVPVYARNFSAAWPSAGVATVFSRDTGGDLAAVTFTYTGKDATSFTGVSALGTAIKKGDRMFSTDSTVLLGIYTHYYEAGRYLPTSLTIEIGRDVAYFTYSGVRVDQLNEVFNAKELLTGKVSVVGRGEYTGGDSDAAITAGDTTVVLKSGTYTIQDGTTVVGFRQNAADGSTTLGTDGNYTLQIEGENEILYEGVSVNLTTGVAVVHGIPASGTGSLAENHLERTPVVPQSTAAETSLVPTSVEPMVSFQAGMYLDSNFIEVMKAEYTLNNNLYKDKFQLGDRFRAQLPEQRREVTGKITVEFDDMVMYRKFVGGTEAELEIRIVDDSANGEITNSIYGTSSVYRQKHIIFPRIKFSGTTPQISGPDVIMVDMPFRSIYDVVDDEPELIMIIVNDVAREPWAEYND